MNRPADQAEGGPASIRTPVRTAAASSPCSVHQGRAQAAGPARGPGCGLAGQAEHRRGGSGGEQGILLDGSEGAGHRRQGAAQGGDARHQGVAVGEAHPALTVGDEVDGPGHDHGAAQRARQQHGGGFRLGGRLRAVDALLPRLRQAGQRDDLRGVAAHDRGPQVQKLGRRLASEGGGADADRIQHPGLAQPRRRARRHAHALDPGRRQRADIDGQRIGDGDELGHLLDGMHHGRRGAHRQHGVGGRIHGHEVGDVLHQRRALAHALQQPPGLFSKIVSKVHANRLPSLA